MKNQDHLSSFARRLRPNAIRRLSHLINRPGMITFAGGVPSPETFPTEEIAEIAFRLVRERGAEVLQYGVTRGNRNLIEQICGYMSGRSMKVLPEEMILTSGSQQGLDLVSRVLIEPGDLVLVELPSYIGGICALHNAGAELVGVQMAEDGLEPSSIQSQIESLAAGGRRVKALYTIPNFQNPSGITLSAKKRAALLELAARYDIFILEDDPYGELYFDSEQPSPAPIKSLDEEGRVVYFGSFSKVLAPGLRTAWIVADPEIATRIEMAKEAADLCSSMLDQAIVSECYRQNMLQGRIAQLRAFYSVRCRAMLDALEAHAPAGAHWTRPTGGLFVWLEAQAGIAATELLSRAVEQEGVAFVPGRPFFVDERKEDNTLRLAFSKETPERIATGIERLCTLLKK
jgi:2-aminoadipate transaminase